MPRSFHTSRHIAAPPDSVYAAMTDPARLARWWGPAGFRNEVSLCEMRPGGRWVFVMHGPDGKAYPNENQFAALAPPHGEQAGRFALRHVGQPLFTLTLSLQAKTKDGQIGTCVDWLQVLDDAELAAQLAPMIEPANEQNLDRLTAEVLATRSPASQPHTESEIDS